MSLINNIIIVKIKPDYNTYNNVETLTCSESKIILGYIPKTIVGINKVINTINSRLVMSFKGFILGEYSP